MVERHILCCEEEYKVFHKMWHSPGVICVYVCFFAETILKICLEGWKTIARQEIAFERASLHSPQRGRVQKNEQHNRSNVHPTRDEQWFCNCTLNDILNPLVIWSSSATGNGNAMDGINTVCSFSWGKKKCVVCSYVSIRVYTVCWLDPANGIFFINPAVKYKCWWLVFRDSVIFSVHV